MKRRSDRLSLAITAAVVVFCAQIYFRESVIPVLPALAKPSDFETYYKTARLLLLGQSPFLLAGYPYPALLSFLIAPLGVIDYLTARWIWFILSQGFIVGACYPIWRCLGRGLMGANIVAIVWAICAAPAAETLALGQVTPMLLLALACACAWPNAWGGALLGFVSAVKPLLVPLIPGLWFARHRRTAYWAFGSLVVFLAAPVLILRMFWPPPYQPAAMEYFFGTPAMLNFSAPAMVLRLLDPPVSRGRLPINWEFGNNSATLHLTLANKAASIATTVLLLGAGYVILARILRSKRTIGPAESLLTLAVLTSLTLAASPLSWSHYQILQAPVAAILITYTLRARRWGWRAFTTACFLLTYRVPVWLLQRYIDTYGWGATGDHPAILYLLTSASAMASLCLAGVGLTQIAEENRQH